MNPRTVGRPSIFLICISPLFLQHLLKLTNRVVVFGGADETWAGGCDLGSLVVREWDFGVRARFRSRKDARCCRREDDEVVAWKGWDGVRIFLQFGGWGQRRRKGKAFFFLEKRGDTLAVFADSEA